MGRKLFPPRKKGFKVQIKKVDIVLDADIPNAPFTGHSSRLANDQSIRFVVLRIELGCGFRTLKSNDITTLQERC